jgi:hypothetical protein
LEWADGIRWATELVGPAAGKKKRENGWAERGNGVWVLLFSFFLSLFFSTLYFKFFSSFQKKLLNHITKQKPMHST